MGNSSVSCFFGLAVYIFPVSLTKEYKIKLNYVNFYSAKNLGQMLKKMP